MDILFHTFLAVHIASGATGLTSGTLNIAMKKGGKRHKIIGKVFLYSMLTAGTAALMLALLHSNYFLFIVGILTIYLTATGQRYLLLKQAANQPGPTDWLLTYGMLGTAIIFMVLGVIRLINADNFGIVFIVFGFTGLLFARTDFVNYSGQSKIKNYWLTGHLQRMTGSYIASLTAFLVVNGKYLPSFVPSFVTWLLPTVMLTPLIIIWSKKYAVKQKENRILTK